MNEISPKLKNAIYYFLDRNSGYSADNMVFDETSNEVSIRDKTGRGRIFYYKKNRKSYLYQGEYPMVYILDGNDLRSFVKLFSTRLIPILIDYYSERFNFNFSYKTLIWGNRDILNDPSIKNGIHGYF